MSRSGQPASGGDRASLGTLGVFLFGVPLGASAVALLTSSAVDHPLLRRYLSHPVEKAEVVLFACGLCAVVGVALRYFRERAALGRQILPKWDGKPAPASEATRYLQAVAFEPISFRETWIGRRLHSVLEFVHRRGNANDLDEQLRALADQDADSLDRRYALCRLLNWSLLGLGMLGTVLGISDAVNSITPESLESSFSSITGSLSSAFDTTTVAVVLMLVQMSLCHVFERLEQGVLADVDDFVEHELTHRFIRYASEADKFIAALNGNTSILLSATSQLVEKQTALWSSTMEKAEKQWTETGRTEQEKLTEAIAKAQEFALTRFAQRLAELEEKLIAKGQGLLDAQAEMVKTIRDVGRESQLTSARLTDTLGILVENLVKVQADDRHLLQLQNDVAKNLEALASLGTFEQTLQSLSGAIHLLTSKVGSQPASATTLRVATRDAA